MNQPPRLLRSRHELVVAGVAGGIAHYLAIDPVLVRLGFIALSFTGVGLLLYPILWLITPLEPETTGQSAAMHVYVAHDSATRRPRFDPMTGQPIEPEDIPVTNIPPHTASAQPNERRNQLLGYALLLVGSFVLLSSLVGLSGLVVKLLLPALLIGAGIMLLRRKS